MIFVAHQLQERLTNRKLMFLDLKKTYNSVFVKFYDLCCRNPPG